MNIASSMETAKIVLMGPVGAGKTTAIRSITNGEPVSTEMPMTEGATDQKSTTTVALDFSSVALDDGTPLFVYGVPGQERFSFMWPLVLAGSLGAIILLDARASDIEESCSAWLDRVADGAPDASVVVGVTHADLTPGFSLARLRGVVKRFRVPVPVFTVDVRSREQTHQLMHALILAAQ